MSIVGSDSYHWVLRTIALLLQEREFDSGRVPILECEALSDLGRVYGARVDAAGFTAVVAKLSEERLELWWIVRCSRSSGNESCYAEGRCEDSSQMHADKPKIGVGFEL